MQERISMEITIAKSAGFCFGVQRAIRIALNAGTKMRTVEMLGDIVHNEEVIEQIKKTGIRKVNRLTAGKNKTLLVQAHGVARGIIEKARSRGYKIVDATCPMVYAIHRVVRAMDRRGYRIILIGDKAHDEVRGIVGQIKQKPIIVEKQKDIIIENIIKIKKAAVVVQSTQTPSNYHKIVKILRRYIADLQIFDTICKATKMRQNEITTLPLHNDVILIIGSRTSANTKRLYDISKSLNRSSYWIQSSHDIKPSWLKNASRIGITAGASTPANTINKVVDYITFFAAVK